MPRLITILEKNEIDRKVAEIAKRVSSDYAGSDLIIVGVLKGAFVFLADLVRKLTIPVKIDFIGASSYGKGTESSCEIRLTRNLETDPKDKDVLIVEDIVDTGLTLSFLVDHLNALGAKSVRICALIDKRERRLHSLDVRYACHVVEKGFLVGYGLDYAEDYRYLPDICHLKF